MDARDIAHFESFLGTITACLGEEVRSFTLHKSSRKAQVWVAEFTCGCRFRLHPAEGVEHPCRAIWVRSCVRHPSDLEPEDSWIRDEVPNENYCDGRAWIPRDPLRTPDSNIGSACPERPPWRQLELLSEQSGPQKCVVGGPLWNRLQRVRDYFT